MHVAPARLSPASYCAAVLCLFLVYPRPHRPRPAQNVQPMLRLMPKSCVLELPAGGLLSYES
jgi:hypothetical protein